MQPPQVYANTLIVLLPWHLSGALNGLPETLVAATRPHQVQLAVSKAAEVITRGGVVALPTDTLYGIGCALDNWCVNRLAP